MPLASSSTGLAITNPLVLYRSFLALKRIDPDPAQHRLAIHLHKLYNRLLDYEPRVEYSQRLEELSRTVRGYTGVPALTQDAPLPSSSSISAMISFGKKDQGPETLALTRKLTNYEAAIQIDSPQGLLIHGGVGTGKSMLIDMLASSLPSDKKRRWHFNTFMLEVFAKIEKQRIAQSISNNGHGGNEYPLLVVARDLISTSPILFLDEFQLPDRAASKILSNLLTSFFHLGGVLIATSNRMPEELATAAGIEFAPPPLSQTGLFGGNRWRFLKQDKASQREKGGFSSRGDFATFFEVLKARCEVWEMENTKDWRRHELEIEPSVVLGGASADDGHFSGLEQLSTGDLGLGFEQSRNVHTNSPKSHLSSLDCKIPYRYFLSQSEGALPFDESLEGIARQLTSAKITTDPKAPIPWESTTLRVYGRNLIVPRALSGVTYWTFEELCCSNLGPADYITLASTYNTFVLKDVPVLTFLHKNEARRFITLLDAMYEAKCKLMIQACAGPDELFFPETGVDAINADDAHNEEVAQQLSGDATLPETFSEVYQDTTSPFRPNVSSYESTGSSPSYQQPARSMLADEDSDFGPTYSAGRITLRGPSDGAPGAGNEMGRQPDFTNIEAFTGEDEKFAYKRARSRLWEMCGRKWWARSGEDWWQPLTPDARHWEWKNNTRRSEIDSASPRVVSSSTNVPVDQRGGDAKLLRHGASPFRTSKEPPPKIGWTHAWGMMRWGKKAGRWGKGVEGIEERRSSEEGNDQRRKR